MEKIIALGVLLPFIGTAAGAACVFFMKNGASRRTNDILAGFAAGVMTAASVWSLLLPALENAKGENAFSSFFPAGAGFCCGMLLLMPADRFLPRVESEYLKGRGGRSGSAGMLALAVTLHNIPEGMAVGVVCASWLTGNNSISSTAALALAIGIAIHRSGRTVRRALPAARTFSRIDAEEAVVNEKAVEEPAQQMRLRTGKDSALEVAHAFAGDYPCGDGWHAFAGRA